MLPYVLVFAISIFSSLIAQKSFRKHRFITILSSTIAVVIPALLAGCRSETIGTDIQVYGANVYIAAGNAYSLSSLYEELYNIDFLFVCLAYLSQFVFDDLSGFLFIVSLVTIMTAYIAIFKLKDQISVPFAFFIYLFLFYNVSLNWMRQCVAISFIILSFACLYKNEKLKCLLCYLCAYLAHQTSAVAIVIYILYWLISQRKLSRKLYYLYLICLPLLLLLYDILLKLLMNFGVISDKFSIYLSSDSESNISIVLTFILLSLVIITRKMVNYCKRTKVYTITNIAIFNYLIVYTTFITSLLSAVSIWGSRISYYFQAILVILLPICIRFGTRKKIVYTYVICILIFILWLYRIVLVGEMETIPYKSEILGI